MLRVNCEVWVPALLAVISCTLTGFVIFESASWQMKNLPATQELALLAGLSGWGVGRG